MRGVGLMRGELHPYDRSSLLPPEDLAEVAEDGPLYALFDPGLDGPEVSALGSEHYGCVWLYTSVPLLVQSCGDGQPYTAVTASQVAQLARTVEGVSLLVALDVWHPDGARYPEPDPQELEPIEQVTAGSADDALVWIPTRPVRSGDRQVSAELYGRRAGEKLLLLFDFPEQAWQACGPYQPLSAIRLDALDSVIRECGADAVVAGNGVVSEEAQHLAPVHDWRRNNRKH